MGGSKYAGVPSVADATAAVDDSGLAAFPPLAMATKVDQFVDEPNDGITVTWEKGEVQPSAYRDKWFAIAFVAHLVAVLGTGIAFGPAMWNNVTADVAESEKYPVDVDEDDGGNLYGASSSEIGTDTQEAPPKEFWFAVVAIALVSAPALSFAALTIMSRNAILLIKGSLWFSVALCGLSAVALLVLLQFSGFFFGILTVCLVCYIKAVHNRIPYAASNLKCAITIVKTNLGLGLIALGSMMGLLGYSFSWVWAFAGTMKLDVMTESISSEDSSDLSAVGGVVAFLFLLSFYWTHQVMKNVVRVSVSGVVGTWWFSPAEAASICSDAVCHSLIRSTTYSFGSICFGSLIVAILHMLRNMLQSAQNNRNLGVLKCIAMCILYYIEGLMEYFNKWAYVYVGLYGYGYIDAGRRVISLFKTRGWQTIIADNLVGRLLGIMSITIGLLTGVLTLFAAFLVEEFEAKEGMQGWMAIGFEVGFFIGLILSGVFLNLILSAVDSVIVCYAEAPNELQESHPAIADEMSKTWAEAWGNLSGPVLVGLGGGLGIA